MISSVPVLVEMKTEKYGLEIKTGKSGEYQFHSYFHTLQPHNLRM